jgi:hypothetical protein
MRAKPKTTRRAMCRGAVCSGRSAALVPQHSGVTARGKRGHGTRKLGAGPRRGRKGVATAQLEALETLTATEADTLEAFVARRSLLA